MIFLLLLTLLITPDTHTHKRSVRERERERSSRLFLVGTSISFFFRSFLFFEDFVVLFCCSSSKIIWICLVNVCVLIYVLWMVPSRKRIGTWNPPEHTPTVPPTVPCWIGLPRRQGREPTILNQEYSRKERWPKPKHTRKTIHACFSAVGVYTIFLTSFIRWANVVYRVKRYGMLASLLFDFHLISPPPNENV